MLTLLLAALLLPPRPATELAARITGAPATDLIAICMRESQCTRVGVHRIDARWSAYACRRAKAVRWLAHDVDCSSGDWATVGAHGLFGAYEIRRLGLARWPWALRVPLLSAIAAGRRHVALCPGDRWCVGGAS